MSALVDTSVLVDFLRGKEAARQLIVKHRSEGPLLASEITRIEILAGMRSNEDHATRSVLAALVWHDVDSDVAERAGALGRQWLPSHQGIDAADLAIAATALLTESVLLTLNVKHFPMFTDLRRPY